MNVELEALAIVRLGSLAVSCVEDLATFRFGSVTVASVGSFAIVSAARSFSADFDFLLATVRFFVIAFTGLSTVFGVDFCVMTWTMSSALF